MNRRQALVLGPAAVATGFTLTACMADERDADLLALLAGFDSLEQRMLDLRAQGAGHVGAEALLMPAIARIEAKQEAYFAPICETPAHTLAGVQARARSLRLWLPELLMDEHCSGWGERFVAATLRDLVALRA